MRRNRYAAPTALYDCTADDEVAAKGREHRCTSLFCRCTDSILRERDPARRQSKTSATSWVPPCPPGAVMCWK